VKIPDENCSNLNVTGGNNPAYDFPEGVKCLADLTDTMLFNQANILKAAMRLYSGKNDTLYELEKIKYYADRERNLLQMQTNKKDR